MSNKFMITRKNRRLFLLRSFVVGPLLFAFACSPEPTDSNETPSQQTDPQLGTQSNRNLWIPDIGEDCLGICWAIAFNAWAATLRNNAIGKNEQTFSSTYTLYLFMIHKILGSAGPQNEKYQLVQTDDDKKFSVDGNVSLTEQAGASFGIAAELASRYGFVRQSQFIDRDGQVITIQKALNALRRLDTTLAVGGRLHQRSDRTLRNVVVAVSEAFALDKQVAETFQKIFIDDDELLRFEDPRTDPNWGKGIIVPASRIQGATRLQGEQAPSFSYSLAEYLGTPKSTENLFSLGVRQGEHAWSTIANSRPTTKDKAYGGVSLPIEIGTYQNSLIDRAAVVLEQMSVPPVITWFANPAYQNQRANRYEVTSSSPESYALKEAPKGFEASFDVNFYWQGSHVSLLVDFGFSKASLCGHQTTESREEMFSARPDHGRSHEFVKEDSFFFRTLNAWRENHGISDIAKSYLNLYTTACTDPKGVMPDCEAQTVYRPLLGIVLPNKLAPLLLFAFGKKVLTLGAGLQKGSAGKQASALLEGAFSAA